MSALAPQERAVFATCARLISCLVTESLARALYIPLPSPASPAIGAAVVLAGHVSAKSFAESPTYTPTDVLTVVPLQHVPVFKHDSTDPRAKEIGLLDPLDMLPVFLLIVNGQGATAAQDVPSEYAGLTKALPDALSGPGWALGDAFKLRLSTSATDLWDKFASSIALESALQADIAEELASSVLWQAYSFAHPPRGPAFESPSIDWEQSIVEGHPTHPMHKTRAFLPPIPDITPGSYDLYHPRIRLAALPRTSLNVTGDFETFVAPVLAGAAKNAHQELVVPDGHIIVPMHELQVHHVQEKFPEAQVYPDAFSVSALAQQSIRSVILPGTLTTTSLKLGVGVKLTSAVRTISPASAYLGPRFSSQVVPALTMDSKILTVAKELASVVHNHPDGEIAKHCAAIIRECHENDSEARGERLIVCTSLVESGHEGECAGVPSIIRVFGLDTEARRLEWLDDFVRVFFAAFLPPMLHNGVGFEAHPQNTVARFSLTTPPKLLGFIIRDFGGLRVQPEILRASTGVELDVAPNHSIIAESRDDVYTRMYHTVVHNHLQQLVRVLGLHYNGKGWDVVRKRLREAIPAGHSLERAWLGPEAKTLPGKCFMRMRMVGMYRHHLHGPFPNLLHYRGENRDGDDGILGNGNANGVAA